MLKAGESKADLLNGDIDTKEKVPDIPNWHTLKLCLMGKAFSGKKT